MSNNSTYPDTPEDVKTELQLTSMVSDFYLNASQYHDPFFDNMVEDYGFWDGTRQWIEKRNGKTVDVKAELEAKGKPALTKNFCFSLVNLLQGIQDDSRLTIKMSPRGSEDSAVAAAGSVLLRHIWSVNKADRMMSKQFFDGNICGRGWLAIEQIDDERDIFGTKTAITFVDPAEIMYDSKSIMYDLSDANYVLRVKVVSRSDAKLLWPDKEYELNQYYSLLDSRIAASRLSDNRLSQLRKDVMILECWYRTRVQKTFLLDSSTGLIHDVSDIPSEQIKQLTLINPNVRILRRAAKEMRLVRTCGANSGVVLDAGLSPYDDNYFPYIPYFAYRSRDLDFGVIQQIKDPQREVNKRDSQTLHIINTMPKMRIITDDAKLANELEEGRDIGVMTKGSNFTVINPPSLPPAHAALKQANQADIKQIAGMPDDLRGFRQAAEAGITVDIRRQQGLQNVSMLFDNLQWTGELCANVIWSRIRQFMTPQQMLRILGSKYGLEVIEALKRKDVEDYDMVAEQSPSSPTLRAENMAKIEKMMMLMPQIVPPDVVIDTLDPPGKEQMLAKLQQATSAAPIPQGQPPMG